ncbi:MAG: hypothetical protein HKN21_10740, partial [Candidatus Eisenbacteria bacterium]|nr:hypothetical protein [Candidatus Eisenbacteria bacterium]
MRRLLGIIGLSMALFVNACGDSDSVTTPETGARISDVVVQINPNNALSTRVDFKSDGIVEAKVVFEDAAGNVSESPYQGVRGEESSLYA